MELINCSIVTVILCQLNIISKDSISETIISCDRVDNCFDNTSHELSVLLQSITFLWLQLLHQHLQHPPSS